MSPPSWFMLDFGFVFDMSPSSPFESALGPMKINSNIDLFCSLHDVDYVMIIGRSFTKSVLWLYKEGRC